MRLRALHDHAEAAEPARDDPDRLPVLVHPSRLPEEDGINLQRA